MVVSPPPLAKRLVLRRSLDRRLCLLRARTRVLELMCISSLFSHTDVIAAYFSLTMILTVGFGDISPATHTERIVSMCSMFIGCSFYGYLVANMSELVGSSDQNLLEYYNKLDIIASYMEKRKFPPDLQYRVRRYFKHFLSTKGALDEQAILRDLSAHLRNEVCLHLLDDTLLGIKLFQHLRLEELTLLLGLLKPVQFSRNTFMVQAGDECSELYIVRSGRMAVLNSRGSVIKPLSPGDYYGELAVFDVDPIVKLSIKAVTFSE